MIREESPRALYQVESSLRQLSFDLLEMASMPEYRQTAIRNSARQKLRDELDKAISSISDVAYFVTPAYHDDISRKKLLALRDALEEIKNEHVDHLVEEYLLSHIKEPMTRLEEKVVSLTGERCIYGLNTPANTVSSLASCIHKVADWVSEYTKAEVPVEGTEKCYATAVGGGEGEREGERGEGGGGGGGRGSSIDPNVEALKRACIEWDKLSEELDSKGYYLDIDYNVLDGRILPSEKRLILRLGSSAGHQTHLDLKNNTLEYYDDDDIVNDIISESLEQYAGLRCDRMGSCIEGKYRVEEGVKCTGLNKDNVVTAAKILAFSTSMIPRLSTYMDELDDILRDEKSLKGFIEDIERLIQKEAEKEKENNNNNNIDFTNFGSRMIAKIAMYFKRHPEKIKELEEFIANRDKNIEELKKELKALEGKVSEYVKIDHRVTKDAALQQASYYYGEDRDTRKQE